MQKLLRIAAWLILLMVFFVTISPIEIRPSSGQPADIERFAAFFFIGFIFTLGYPRKWILILIFMTACAALFELLQNLAPSRHAELADFLVKTIGAASGVFIGRLFSLLTLLISKSKS